jgi:MraZ protein
MLIGEYTHNLDSKGRLILPSKFRDEIGDTFIITCGLESSLIIYTEEGWNEYVEKLQSLPYHKKDLRAYIRLVLSKANQVETDKMGRFTIPPNLRKFADLKKEVIIIGINDKIELWSKDKWDEYSKNAIDNYEDKAEMIGEFE